MRDAYSWEKKGVSPAGGMLCACLCFCICAATAAMASLQVQTIIDDMTKPHEAKLSGVPTSHDWGSGPRIGWGNNPPDDWSAATAWGQIYREADKSIPANTRIHIRNFEAYQLKKSTGNWVKLQDSDEVGIGGGAYVESFADDANKEPNVRNEGNNSLSVKLEYGYNYHFWPKSRSWIDPNDIGAMFCVFEARLILDTPNGADDRNQARILAGSGGDYWRNTSAQWKSDWSNNGDFAIGRMRFVTSDWQYFTVCTYDPIHNVGDNPPPPVGETQQPDKSPPSAPSNLSASVAGNSQIELSWSKASDPESGIDTYIIYRNGDKVGTTDNTSYNDKELDEGTEYTYRVSAVNGEGKEGDKSNEASATTHEDSTPPKLASVVAVSETSIKVTFTEPVTKESAEKTAHYSIREGIGVSGASLDTDNKSVMLTVSTLTLKKTYTLTVSNITDRASTPNTGGDQKQFTYSGELHITNIVAASGRSYEFVKTVAEGDDVYIDRDYTFTSLGDYAGMACIRTANDDKNETEHNFLSFDINRPVTVYVALDKRVVTPSWLSSWDNTGDEVHASDSYMGGMEIFSSEFDAGTVTLGPNGTSPEEKSMYCVFIDAREDETNCTPHNSARAGVSPSVRVGYRDNVLQVSGLYPNRVYTMSLTDARGRVSSVLNVTNSEGMASFSASHWPSGVYIVNMRTAEHHFRSIMILP